MRLNFKVKLFSFLLMTCLVGFGQNNGDFGSKNSFGIAISGMPTVRNTYAYDATSSIISRRRRLAYLNYNVDYSFTISRKIELDISAIHSRIKTYTIGEFPYNLQYLHDPVFSYNQINIGMKYYRLGSVAPVGKYIGFSISGGLSSFDSTDIFLGLKNLPLKENTFSSEYTPFEILDSTSAAFNLKTLQFVARVGRNYVITDYLSLGCEFQIPLFTGFQHNGTWFYRSIDEIFGNYDYTTIFEKTVRKYSFIRGKISINIHF